MTPPNNFAQKAVISSLTKSGIYITKLTFYQLKFAEKRSKKWKAQSLLKLNKLQPK